ncbi:tryptophan-rich sensory protein [Microlunatus elymi]|uniref:Tryptophan-rich sensory protein n=1 Tax=Microlunatus elymi TaxID=2596828 RepID=A0A516PW95_9ACTN|nr:TspO/MBR family protein [Microlunatus elymi]QDP95429.1 tryptophan-rich sensory protein [Microlunatus elymi]
MSTELDLKRRSFVLSAAVVAAAAVAGSVGVDPKSRWYRSLRKPDWQPPAQAFGLVWTPLYAAIAWSGGRTLSRISPAERSGYVGTFAVNLVLNAGWNWLFFRARSPLAGLVGIAALNVSNAQLIKKTTATDRAAAAALLPYAAWCGFATALNASIWRLNRHE